MSQIIKNPLLSIHSVKTPKFELPSINFPLIDMAPSEEDWDRILAEIDRNVDYFHRDMDRHVADCYLMQGAGLGAFLLRNEKGRCENFFILVLSVRGYHSVKHFRVTWDGTTFTFGKHSFESLDLFLEHLHSTPVLAESSGSFLPVQNAMTKCSSVGNIYDAIDACTSDLDSPEQIDRRVSPPPDLSIAPKEGYLTVQAPYSKKWQTIWVAVNKMILSCFKHKEQKKPYQTFNLNEFSIEIDVGSPLNNGFKLYNAKRSVIFRTNTQEEVKSWFSLIEWKMEKKSSFTLFIDK